MYYIKSNNGDICIGYCGCELIHINKYKFSPALKCKSGETPATLS